MGFPAHLIGNLTSDLELRYTQNGVAVANGTVAVNERKLNRTTNEWEDGDATFIRISIWRELGEHAAASLPKGTRVIVTGKLDMRRFETKDGTEGSALEMQVDDIGPSMRFATAQVTRSAPQGQRSPQGQTPQMPAGYAPQQGPPGYAQQGPPPGWPATGASQSVGSQTVWPGQPSQEEPW